MKKLLLLQAMLMISCFAFAEKHAYTVMAESGLFMREGPSRDTKKIGSVPFGEVVYQESRSGETTGLNYSYEFSPEIDTTIIEGIAGHWIAVRYYNLKGFVFSGFVVPGIWILKASKGVNEDYRILEAGYQNGPMNYDPALNWYAITEREDKTILEKVDISFQLWHSYEDEEMKGFSDVMPINILVNGERRYCWLIGTKNELLDTLYQKRAYIQEGAYFPTFDKGIFIYPTQQFTFGIQQGQSSYLKAEEKITLDPNSGNGYKRNYTISVGRYQFPNGENMLDLTDSLHVDSSAAQQRMYSPPLLHWVGDLNGDLYADFIMSSSTPYDSYSGSSLYVLYLSDASAVGGYRLVARHELWFYDLC